MESTIEELLAKLVENKGSDLFITVGAAPSIKVLGQLSNLSDVTYTSKKTREIILGIMNDSQRADFERTKECNFAISIEKLGRFRVSAFQQRSTYGAVFRRIETKIPTVEDLGMPK